jgi:hypothetical protein
METYHEFQIAIARMEGTEVCVSNLTEVQARMITNRCEELHDMNMKAVSELGGKLKLVSMNEHMDLRLLAEQ